MTDDRSFLQKGAMLFGTQMGIYWIIKFTLFPLGFYIQFFSLLFTILTLAVPILGYHYAKQYRNTVCGGSIGYSHAVIFLIFMYMFASLLTAVVHYIYFQFIDHGFVFDSYLQLWEQAVEQMPSLSEDNESVKMLIETIRSRTPIQIVMQMLSFNMFWSSLVSIPTAILVMKKANNGTSPQP